MAIKKHDPSRKRPAEPFQVKLVQTASGVELQAVDKTGNRLATLLTVSCVGVCIHKSARQCVENRGGDVAITCWDDKGRIKLSE